MAKFNPNNIESRYIYYVKDRDETNQTQPFSVLALKNSLRLLCVTGGEWDIIRRQERRCEDHPTSSYRLRMVAALNVSSEARHEI
ncbi:hypothetical protein PanWU01x14_259550, partial [Parasponia andersonii]